MYDRALGTHQNTVHTEIRLSNFPVTSQSPSEIRNKNFFNVGCSLSNGIFKGLGGNDIYFSKCILNNSKRAPPSPMEEGALSYTFTLGPSLQNNIWKYFSPPPPTKFWLHDWIHNKRKYFTDTNVQPIQVL